MSSFNRPVILAVALLAVGFGLSACGFKPLYGAHENAPKATQSLAQIKVDPIPDRTGQIMRTALVRRLNTAKQMPAQFSLAVQLSEHISKLAVERSAFATRANLTLSVNYQLVRLSDHQQLASGKIQSVASYNILSSNFATFAAENDARTRAVNDLADKIQTRLAIYFAGPGTTASTEPAPARVPVYP